MNIMYVMPQGQYAVKVITILTCNEQISNIHTTVGEASRPHLVAFTLI